MARRKQKNYKGYKAGFNSKGLPIRREEDQKPTTARGLRRQQTEKKTHVHRFVLWDTKLLKSDSYHEARIQNELRFYCKQSNELRPNGGGGGTKKGGGKRVGCGCCVRPTSPAIAQ